MSEAAGGRGDDPVLADVRMLVDRYRTRCLWFLAEDYYPETKAEVLRVLHYIERHGDREAFQAAAQIRRWLSPTFSDTSAAS
jgi:hypothetical protein